MFEVNAKVEIVNNFPAAWFAPYGKTYPETLHGIVRQTFKNGKVSVWVKELNKVFHFKAEEAKFFMSGWGWEAKGA